MEDKYISKEAVVRYLKGYSEKECNSNSPYGMITSSVLDKAERALSEMPAADVQPVKHGKWKHVAGMNSKCSVCSHYFPVTEFDSRPFDINYCPNCGARMDGDTE